MREIIVNLLDFEEGQAILRRGCGLRIDPETGKLLQVEPNAGSARPPREDAFEWWMPGLVNPHSHLELTGLAGAIPPTRSFPEWGRHIFRYKSTLFKEDAFPSAKRGAAQSLAAGVTAMGDICTSLAGPLALADSPLRAVLYAEVIAIAEGHDRQGLIYFRHLLSEIEKVCAWHPKRLFAGVSPHAPHTVMPSVMREVGEGEAQTRRASIHVAETVAELEYLLEGKGEFRAFFDEVKLLPAGWRPVGKRPAECCDFGALLRPRSVAYRGAGLRERCAGQAEAYSPDTIIAHGNYLNPEEAQWLAERRVAVCWCPETHEFFGHAAWPSETNRALPVLLGTDSLASAWSLDPLDQLARALTKLDAARGPLWPMADLLQSVTLRARDCLLGRDAGSPDADFTVLNATGPAASALRDAPDGEPLSEALLRNLFDASGRENLRASGGMIGGEPFDAETWRAKG